MGQGPQGPWGLSQPAYLWLIFEGLGQQRLKLKLSLPYRTEPTGAVRTISMPV